MRHCKIEGGNHVFWFNENEHWAACLGEWPTNKPVTITWFRGRKS